MIGTSSSTTATASDVSAVGSFKLLYYSVKFKVGYATLRRRQEHIKLVVWGEQLRHQQDQLRQLEEQLRQRRSQVTLARTKRALDDAEMDFLFSSVDKRNKFSCCIVCHSLKNGAQLVWSLISLKRRTSSFGRLLR